MDVWHNFCRFCRRNVKCSEALEDLVKCPECKIWWNVNRKGNDFKAFDHGMSEKEKKADQMRAYRAKRKASRAEGRQAAQAYLEQARKRRDTSLVIIRDYPYDEQNNTEEQPP